MPSDKLDQFSNALGNYLNTQNEIEGSEDKFSEALRSYLNSDPRMQYSEEHIEEAERAREFAVTAQKKFGIDINTAAELYKAHKENRKMGYWESSWHFLRSEYSPSLLKKLATSIRPGLRLKKHLAGSNINVTDKGNIVYAALKQESPYFVDEKPTEEDIQASLNFGFPKNVAYAMTFKTAQQLYVKGLRLYAKAKKYEQSDQRQKDLATVDEYFQHIGQLEAQASKGQTALGVLGTGVTASAAFMLELVGTKGITKLLSTPAKAGIKVAKEAVEKTAKGALLEIATGTARQIPGSIGRTVLQATAMPSTTINALKSMMPHIKAEDNEYTITEGGERPFNAFASSLLDTMISVQAEKAGATIEQVGGVFLQKMPTGRKILSALQKGFKQKNPGSGIAEFSREFFRRAEFHGVFGEMAEERLEDWMRWGLGRQENLLPSMEEWAVELGVLGILKGGQVGLTAGATALETAARPKPGPEEILPIEEVPIKEPEYARAGEAVQAAAKELAAKHKATFIYDPDQPLIISNMINDPDFPAFTEKAAAELLKAHDLPADTDLDTVQLVGYNRKGSPILGTSDEIRIAQGGNVYDVVEEVFESNYKNLRPEQQTDLQQELKAYELVNGRLSEGNELERLSDLARAAAFDQKLHKKLGFKLKEIVDKLKETIYRTIRHAKMLRSQVKAGNVSPAFLKKLKDVTYQRAIDKQLGILGGAVTPSMLAKQIKKIGDIVTPQQIKEGIGTAFREQAVQPTGERIPAAIQQQVARPGEKPGFEVMGEQRTQSEVEKLRQDVEFWKGKAQTDRLTGLKSKDYAAERLPEVLRQSSEAGKPVSVIFMDLTNFKALNEMYGHEKADKALIVVGQAVREVTRKDRGDELAFSSRYGGDELLLTLPGANAFDADRIAQRVKRLVDQRLREIGMHQVVQEGKTWPISLNEGIVTQQPGELLEASELIERADLESQKRRAELNKLYGLEPGARFVKKETPTGGELSAAIVRILPPLAQDLAPVKITSKKGVKAQTIRGIKQTGSLISDLITPISTALGEISVPLKRRLKVFEYSYRQVVKNDLEAVTPFVKKMAKLPSTVKAAYDLALKNGDIDTVWVVNKKYGLTKDYAKVQNILDEIYNVAKTTGIDLGYTENFMPRTVKDIDELRTFLAEKRNQKYWSAFEAAIRQRERELGKKLEGKARIDYINQLIRGYGSSRIQITAQGHTKGRVLKTLDEDTNQHYFTSEVALVQYIQQMREAIEARKMFGMTKVDDDIGDSIGAFVQRMTQQQAIVPEQERKVVEIFTARFSSRSPRGILRKYRDFEYIETLGSPIVALTQLEDMGVAWYRAGLLVGLPRVLSNFAKAALNKSDIKLVDLGVFNIAAEMTNPAQTTKILDYILTITGFKYLDRIGKEATINTIVQTYQKQAKNPTKDFRRRMENIFGNRAEEVTRNMANGTINADVQYLAFAELLDIQPVALSEVPLKYLQMSDGKVLYMLKTFMLRRLDMVLNETIRLIKINPVQGIVNGMRLSAALLIMGIGADEIKDWIMGRQTSLKDQTTDGLLRIAGLSKYTIYEARTRGDWKSVISRVAPPFKIVDSIGRDIRDLTKGKYTGSESLASIPLIGKILYWQYGKGAKKTEEKIIKERPQTLSKILRKRVGPKKEKPEYIRKRIG